MKKLILFAAVTLISFNSTASTFNVVWNLENSNTNGDKKLLISALSEKINLPLNYINEAVVKNTTHPKKSLYISTIDVDIDFSEIDNDAAKKLLMESNYFKDAFPIDMKP